MKLYLNGAEQIRFGDILFQNDSTKYITLNFSHMYQHMKPEQRDKLIKTYINKGFNIGIHSGAQAINKRYVWFEFNKETGKQEFDENRLPNRVRDKLDNGIPIEDIMDGDFNAIFRYIDHYTSFISKWMEYIDYAQEVNLPRLGPIFRRKHHDQLAEISGMKCMIILEKLEDPEFLIELYSRPWVKILAFTPDNIELDKAFILNPSNHFVSNNVLFHALGAGSSDKLNVLPVYSADTSNWNNGSRYKTIYRYLGNLDLDRYIELNKGTKLNKDKLNSLKKSILENGIDFDKFSKGNPDLLDQWNLNQYLIYSEELEHKKLALEYWISDQDKNDIIANYRKTTGSDIVLYENNSSNLSTYTGVTNSIARYCNTCMIQMDCPLYKPDSTCGYSNDNLSIQNPAELNDAVSALMQLQMQRVLHAARTEIINGGALSEALSKEIASTMDMLEKQNNIMTGGKGGNNVEIKAPASVFTALFGQLNSTKDSSSPVKTTNSVERSKTIDMDKDDDIEDADYTNLK